jgi:hypothetical protein
MAAVVGGESPNKSILDTQANIAKLPKLAFSSIQENALKNYSNLTYLWTFAPLGPKQVAMINADGKFDTIKLNHVVISSAGRLEDKRAQTFYGAPEYFIDNVEIFTLATPTAKSGLSGNATVHFDVFEPYSVGLFLQSCQSASLRTGYASYIDACWLLKLEFYGYNPTTKKQERVEGATRDYPLKLQQVSFTANEGGSRYQVKCIDFSLEAYNNVIGTYSATTSFTADTVQDALGKLAAALNTDQKKAVDDGSIQIADEYEILILDDKDLFPSAEIAQSKFVKAEDQGSSPGSNASSQTNEAGNRSNKPKPGSRTFSWSRLDGRRIVDMIGEIIKASEFCANSLKKGPDSKTGMITWYRPSSKVNFLEDEFKLDTITNRPAYKITYLVHPYLAHHGAFKTPSAQSQGFTADGLLSLIKKQYSYIYTGANDDILKWELKFDNTFYTAIPVSSPGNQPGTIQAKGAAIRNTPSASNAEGTNVAGLYLETPAGKLFRDTASSYRKPMGGGTADDIDIRVARAFEEALLTDTENIMLDISILGDPYYLTRSGVFVDKNLPTEANSQITNDLTMNSEYGEVRIYVRFKTPIDAPVLPKTLFEFPAAGYNDSAYSGLYRIRSVRSKFNDGMFTQELNLFRDRGQQPEELKNTRRDPNALLAGQPAPDTRDTSNSTPAAGPTPVVTESRPVPPQTSVVPTDLDMIMTKTNPATGNVETFNPATNRGVNNAPGVISNKIGPLGNKLDVTDELLKQINEQE